MNGKLAIMQERLAVVIETWINAEADDGNFPVYVGEGLHHIMAKAAMAVIEGMADAEEYLRDGGMLNEV